MAHRFLQIQPNKNHPLDTLYNLISHEGQAEAGTNWRISHQTYDSTGHILDEKLKINDRVEIIE